MDSHEEMLRHFRFSADVRSRTTLSRQAARGELAQIRRGCYVESEYLRSRDTTWEVAEVVMLARIVASARACPGSVAVGTSAALLHALSRFEPSDSVTLARSGRTHAPRRSILPAVVVGDDRFAPQGNLVVHHLSPVVIGTPEKILETQTASLDGTILSTALLSGRESGFVVACGGLARAGAFSRTEMDQSRLNERRVRSRLLRTLDQLPRRSRGISTAKWLLGAADAACESVGEQRLLYILRCAEVRGMKTQHLVAHRKGKYYLDMALPELMLGIEFDGQAKYGRTAEERLEAKSRELQREANLRAMGWEIVRFRWRDLDEPRNVLERVRMKLAKHRRVLSRGTVRVRV